MAMQKTQSENKFGQPYICGVCGYKLHLAREIQLEVFTDTIPVSGERPPIVRQESPSVVCPNCGNHLGRIILKNRR